MGRRAAPDLKIRLGPGEKLSAALANSRSCYKVIETDRVLGYAVSPGGPGSTPAVYPLYSAVIHMRVAGSWHLVMSHERGDRYNGFTYDEDSQGCTFAAIAAQAVSALETRSSVQTPGEQAKRKKGHLRG